MIDSRMAWSSNIERPGGARPSAPKALVAYPPGHFSTAATSPVPVAIAADMVTGPALVAVRVLEAAKARVQHGRVAARVAGSRVAGSPTCRVGASQGTFA